MRWNINSKPNPSEVRHLMDVLHVDELIAQLLVQRGITTYEEAKGFFRPTLNDLHNPYLMKDMEQAVVRIEQAVNNRENILVFGDYDVDGTTAVSLMASYLRSYYPNVATYIPDRYTEGYGVSFQGIDFAEDNGMTLIIALDCGIKSIDHVNYAKAKGIDFIICDHHRPGDSIPDAIAVLDPKREDCSYPYDELCGCGVGFKLIQALAERRGQTVFDLVPYLDLVATAIAADIVPITGENRILAKFGLEVINSSPRPGLKALLSHAKKSVFTITEVVFTIAPRINAAGRIKHGNAAVELLTSLNLEQAIEFANAIEQHNKDRRELDKAITEEALRQIQDLNETERYTTVVYYEEWHKGVIGIVASRLIATYYRPTVVFTKSGDQLAASARSINDFDLYEAIEACSEHLIQFGGHKHAAGMTLLEENYPAFKAAFEAFVKRSIDPNLLVPEILIDAEINLTDVSPKLIRLLKQFEPFGPGNMTPIFLAKDLIDTGYGKCIGNDEAHLKLSVKQGQSEIFGVIGFGLREKLSLTQNRQKFDAVFCLEENEFKGTVSLQLRLKDLR
ncbi:single-stranded-DNA-specific exonuclease RecJ [Flavobacterium sp.]|uniref:single-stranded-DNA-specific exonuclease RecJ n=1 Tax=Flavobacterium sp. TaxID=239 RepID=UPI002621D206|nr:single-stranded-DNA-specific exonuclease RecJ [Flavobacterium sp.]